MCAIEQTSPCRRRKLGRPVAELSDGQRLRALPSIAPSSRQNATQFKPTPPAPEEPGPAERRLHLRRRTAAGPGGRTGPAEGGQASTAPGCITHAGPYSGCAPTRAHRPQALTKRAAAAQKRIALLGCLICRGPGLQRVSGCRVLQAAASCRDAPPGMPLQARWHILRKSARPLARPRSLLSRLSCGDVSRSGRPASPSGPPRWPRRSAAT